MDGINWEGLKGRNVFGDFASGLEYGGEMRRDRQKAESEAARMKALNLFATDPVAAERDLMAAGDVETAETLRKRREAQATEGRRRQVGGMVGQGDYKGAQAAAAEGGDFDMMASIAKMDEAQRKAARDNAEDLAGFAMGIKGAPYEQRKSIIQQAIPILAERGFTPEQIAGFDPTDANLDALAAQGMDLKTALEEAARLRDDKRADGQAAETARANRVREGQGAARLSLSRDANARGWAAHKARLAGKGGYGTPGVGGVIADEDVEIDP